MNAIERIERHKIGAEARAAELGHRLSGWERVARWQYRARCLDCGAGVTVGSGQAVGEAVENWDVGRYGERIRPLTCEERTAELPLAFDDLLRQLPPPHPHTGYDHRELRWTDTNGTRWRAYWRNESWWFLALELVDGPRGASVLRQHNATGYRRAVMGRLAALKADK